MNRTFWKGWAAGLATVAGLAYANELQTRFSIGAMSWRPGWRVPVVMIAINDRGIILYTRRGPCINYRRTRLDRLRPPIPKGVWPKPGRPTEGAPSAIRPVQALDPVTRERIDRKGR